MHLKKALIMLLLLVILPFNIYAYSDYIYAGGETVGIRVNSNGVLVVGTYSLDKKNKINLQVGDVINTINNKSISSSTDFIDSIKGKSVVSVGYIRGNKEYKTDLNIVLENGVYKSGLYVKDSITGIGTLTFIDPSTNRYGALGHSITDSKTNIKFDVRDGKIFKSNVVGVDKSRDGYAGEKNAKFYFDTTYGTIDKNLETGIYGTYNDDYNSDNLILVGDMESIKLGKAYIRTTLTANKIEEFEIEILEVNKTSETKNILFQITDNNLITKTGGIVRGMSGSPIIQDDKIIGAVTHTVVSDNTKGYGISIIKMLESIK